MPQRCVTRAIKNARHLQATAPFLLPKDEPPQGFGSRIPDPLLSRLHIGLRPEDLHRFPDLAEFLRRSPVPRARATALAPLFKGTLVFVQVTLQTPSGPLSLAAADLNIALSFATQAIVPISRYASQFGPNSLAVSGSVVPLTANLPNASYNDQTLQGWVNALVARGGLPADMCVVILNPSGAVNVDADPRKGIGGYHSLARVPYLFVNVMGRGLTVQDSADVFALALSHEIAEMVVDPRADLSNPEVCDPCGPNCQTAWIDYFDGRGAYLGTTQSFPPPFGYAFFINGIVRPNAATMCPAPEGACNYAPP